MTPDQIALIRQNFALVRPNADAVAATFYARLFEIAPEVRPLFKADLSTQGKKLMTMLGMVVGSLDRLDAIVPAVRDLGRRHVGYGVADDQYDMVGAALLWTLENGLGAAFTPAALAAWTEAYTVLATVMKEAAAKAAQGDRAASAA